MRFRLTTYNPFTFLQTVIVLVTLAFFTILQQYIQHIANGFDFSFSWRLVGIRTGGEFIGLLLAIPLLSNLIEPLFKTPSSRGREIIQFSLGIVFLTALHRIFSLVFFELLYRNEFDSLINIMSPQIGRTLWPGIFSSFIQLTLASAIVWGKYYFDQYTKQQQLLIMAELKALKMQLHPHFLFNTFNSITAMIDLNPSDAQLMLSRLSFLLRSLLEKAPSEQVTLQDEVDFIRHYLGIEEVRFQDRLKIQYRISADTLLANIPSMILLPLVENAIKHGISQVIKNGKIEIGSEKIGLHTLKIWVEDNGPGISEGKQGFGIGLSNIQQRLEQCYDDNFHFEALPLTNKGYRITLLIPLEFVNTPFHVYKHVDH